MSKVENLDDFNLNDDQIRSLHVQVEINSVYKYLDNGWFEYDENTFIKYDVTSDIISIKYYNPSEKGAFIIHEIKNPSVESLEIIKSIKRKYKIKSLIGDSDD